MGSLSTPKIISMAPHGSVAIKSKHSSIKKSIACSSTPPNSKSKISSMISWIILSKILPPQLLSKNFVPNPTKSASFTFTTHPATPPSLSIWSCRHLTSWTSTRFTRSIWAAMITCTIKSSSWRKTTEDWSHSTQEWTNTCIWRRKWQETWSESFCR